MWNYSQLSPLGVDRKNVELLRLSPLGVGRKNVELLTTLPLGVGRKNVELLTTLPLGVGTTLPTGSRQEECGTTPTGSRHYSQLSHWE